MAEERAPHPAEPRCDNCGEVLTGAATFCSACGQAAEPIQLPISHFIKEVIEEYAGVDGRLLRSLGALFFRPGRLTLEYLAGRRTRYLRPLRLYVTASVLFFFSLSLVNPLGVAGIGTNTGIGNAPLRAADRIEEIDVALTGLDAGRDAMVRYGGTDEDNLERIAESDSTRARLERERARLRVLPSDSLVRPERALAPDDPVGMRDSGLPRWLRGPAVQQLIDAQTPEEAKAAKRALVKAVFERVPTAMFMLLPVFAVMLKLLYASGGGRRRPVRRSPFAARRRKRLQRRPWRRAARGVWRHLPLRVRASRRRTLRAGLEGRRTRYLSEHLVFALHVHAYAFFVFLLILGLGQLGEAGWISPVVWLLALSIPVYFLLAQKRVYAQGWGRTLVKAWLLGTGYSVGLVFAALTALALAAALG